MQTDSPKDPPKKEIRWSSRPLTSPKINKQSQAKYYTQQMKRVIDGYLWQGFHMVELVGHINKRNLFITLERLNQLMDGEIYLGSTVESVKLNLKPSGEIELIRREFEKLEPPED